MNHTDVNNMCILSQRVKDEIARILDATDIGTDEEFIICDTEVITQRDFESRNYCRVPCTICKVYIRQVLPRNHRKIYRLAYKSDIDRDGNSRTPFYRVIKLKSQLSYTHPSGNALYTFTVDSSTNSVTVDNGNSAYTLPMSNMLDTPIDAISYHGNSPRRNYDYTAVAPTTMRSGFTDAGYVSFYTPYNAAGDWSLR